jgi:hypothetical protein
MKPFQGNGPIRQPLNVRVIRRQIARAVELGILAVSAKEDLPARLAVKQLEHS